MPRDQGFGRIKAAAKRRLEGKIKKGELELSAYESLQKLAVDPLRNEAAGWDKLAKEALKGGDKILYKDYSRLRDSVLKRVKKWDTLLPLGRKFITGPRKIKDAITAPFYYTKEVILPSKKPIEMVNVPPEVREASLKMYKGGKFPSRESYSRVISYDPDLMSKYIMSRHKRQAEQLSKQLDDVQRALRRNRKK